MDYLKGMVLIGCIGLVGVVVITIIGCAIGIMASAGGL